MLSVILAVVALCLFLFALYCTWLAWQSGKAVPIALNRSSENPILSPTPDHWWESQAVFNPAAVVYDGKVHLFYRALGSDGVSRLGYASSADGVHFERLTSPVYAAESYVQARDHRPFTSPARLTYDTVNYGSGGGWGGCEDPRAVEIDGKVYMTFNLFNGWESMRVGLTSLDGAALSNAEWIWKKFRFLSHQGDRHKNWVLFPEKINGKYALFHNLFTDDINRVQVEYFDDIDSPDPLPRFYSHDPQQLPDREVAWHNRTRSAGPPPIATPEGYIVLYHAMDKNDPGRYKLGALLLDKQDPTKVLYRSSEPILSPDAWYENDWKAGIVYASGAVVFNGQLLVYYGGGDKHVCVAKMNMQEFLGKLMQNKHKVY